MMSGFLCSAITVSFLAMIAITMMGTRVQAERKGAEQQCDCGSKYTVQEAKGYLAFAESSTNLKKSRDKERTVDTDANVKNCKVKDCQVTCQFVNEREIVKHIQNLELKKKSCDLIKLLTLDNCNFTAGGIQTGFLSTLNTEVKRLEIVNSGITFILIGAFSSRVFVRTLTSLTIDNSWTENSDQLTLQLYEKEIFLGLASLSTLEIINVQSLQVIDIYCLQLLSATLTSLKIQGISNRWNPGDLLSQVTMKKLSTVDLSSNNIKSINGLMFTGIADKVAILYLQSSKIESIDIETFDNFKALRRLYLQNNLIATIDHDLFNNLLTVAGFRVNLQNNKWNCICDLEHLQETILANSASFGGTIKCVTPETLKNMAIIEADLCPYLDTTDEDDQSSSPGPDVISTVTTEITTTTAEASINETTLKDTSTEEFTEAPTSTTATTSVSWKIPTGPIATTSPEMPTTISLNDTLEFTSTPMTSSTPRVVKTLPPQSTTTDQQTSSKIYGEENLPIDIVCSRDSTSIDNEYDDIRRRAYSRYLPTQSNDSVELLKPPIIFSFERGLNENEVQISFEDYYIEIFLVYYPGFLDFSNLNSESARSSVNCIVVSMPKVLVRDLISSTVYTFCALFRNVSIETPFQCKPYAVFDREPWIFKEQKAVILTSFLLLLMLSLLVGIVTTYLLIRRMPTLIRGSKRVVMVNNRTKEVMVLPRPASMQKGTDTTQNMESPSYLTPRPRQSVDDRPPFVRCSSDTSIGARSYISVSKSPPRFSQVFQPSDFRYEMPTRCGSFPQCHNLSQLPGYSPDPIPPPLPRRSIASNASTAEMRKTSKNSIYRHSRIDDEIENHYNVII